MKRGIPKLIVEYLVLVLLFYNISFACAGEILLDDQNPLQFYFPNVDQISQLDVRFTFPETSSGISYGQYIGVAFPNSFASDLSFDKGSTAKFKCTLVDYTNNIIYQMKAEKPTYLEPSYVYCQHDDKINSKLKTGSKFLYKLTVSLTGIKIYSSNYIKNFLLFTATSNSLDKIIIDQSLQFGTFVIYPKWEDNKIKAFEILSQSLLSGINTIQKVYPYQSFDVSFTLKSNVLISSAEINLMIRYPADLVSAASGVDSTEDQTTSALKGSLQLNNIQNNFLFIDGIDDTFTPGKIFNLRLKNFLSFDKNLNISKGFELFIFYKNTYSILSYSKTPDNFLTILTTSLQLSVNHPEGLDIWRHALWPMTFQIKNGSNQLKNGGFILLQHSNAIDNEIKWNFVASTCDFSDNQNIDNSFGKRPVCYPLRTDFDYINASGGAYSGSAIFFKIGALAANQILTLTVWGSADNCGGNNKISLSSALYPDTAFRQFKFKVYVYSNINQYETNEKRFIGNNITVLAQSDEVIMTNKCFNNIITGIDFSVTPSVSVAKGAGRLFPRNEFLKKNIFYDDADKKASSDLNLFREFYNFELSNETSGNTQCTTCHLFDITKNSFNNAFIYGDKSVLSNSYFSVRLSFLAYALDNSNNKAKFDSTNASIPAEYLPINVAYNAAKNISLFPGRLQFLFSKKWFTTGNLNSCYISWGMNSKDVTNINKDIALLVDDSTGTTTSQSNWITTNPANTQAWIDSTNSCFPTNSNCTNFKILSKHHTGVDNTSNQFSLFKDIATPLVNSDTNASQNFNKFAIYFFSTCLKWAQNSNNIRSLYSYIEFQMQWIYSDNSTKIGVPNRNLRLIKLFPEAGVFNDNLSTDSKFFLSRLKAPLRPKQQTDQTYLLHYALGSSSSTTGICIIEISGKNLMDIITASTTHLSIWIGFGVILETDYNDISSSYPVTPINPVINIIYAFQSPYFLNKTENLIFNNTESIDGSVNISVFRGMLISYAKTGSDNSSGALSNNDYNLSNDLRENIYNNFSSYYFLMGSHLLITQSLNSPMLSLVGTEKDLRNILIPIYCPLSNTNIYFGNGLPTLYIASINMKAYNDIVNIERILTVNLANTDPDDNKALYSVILSTVLSSNPENYRNPSNLVSPKSINTASATYSETLITIRWAAYTSTSLENNDSYIFLYNGTKGSPNIGKGGTCTSFIFLLHDSISVNSAILKSSFSNIINYYHASQKKFYFLGKEFTKAITISLQNASSSNSNIIINNNPLDKETSQNYFVGIKRPLIDYYYVNNQFIHASDKVGFFCADSKNKENFTNFLFNASSTSKIFFVDFNFPGQDSSSFVASINADKSEQIYKNDMAANLRLSASTPASAPIPAGGSINFSFSDKIINSASICALNIPDSIASACTISNSIISCKISKSINKFDICCYNISYLGIISSDTIVLNSLYVTVPYYPDTSFSDFYTQNIYNESNATRFTWLTSHNSAYDILTFSSSSISNIQYTHVVQDSGICKINFTVALAREPTRNIAITFYADLSAFYIPNTTPRCFASFGYNSGLTPEASGDILLDSCNVSNLGKSINSIKIVTKSLIYKCGISFSKTLNVLLWPIIAVNFTVSPYNTQNFRILMTLNNESNHAITLNTLSFNIQDTQIYLSKPLLSNQWETLCPVVSIDPRIPGELADYLISIDIDSYRSWLVNTVPNELTFFFPYNYYSSILESVNCYNSNYMLSCNFSDEGILNIRLPKSLQIGSGKKLEILITGIINPSLDSNQNIYFPCTLNKTNFVNDSRQNLITGSGKLTGGITLPTTLGKIGNLRFLIFNNPNLDLNPRNLSNKQFRIGFDLISSITNLPITIQNYPTIIFNLPSDYKLSWYDNTKITVTIDEYLSDEKTFAITKANNFIPQFVTTTGNKITIVLGQESYTFKSNFQFFEIYIKNLYNPPEDTSNPDIPLSSGTKLFSIILTNKDYSSVFKTHTNTNNNLVKAFEKTVDPWLTYYKTFNYKFDKTKWILDIGTRQSPNKIYLRAGRYITSYFILRNESIIGLNSKSVVISLIDSTFKLFQQSYSVNTSSTDPYPFMIGAPCGSQLGNYIVNFKSSDSIYFAPLSPVVVNLSNSVTASISYLNPPTIPKAGSTFIYFYISEPNFDELKLEFFNDENYKNDTTSEITSATIPSATITELEKPSNIFGKFSIKNNQVSTPQVFKLTNPNTCYSWSQKALTIYISGSLTSVPSNLNFIKSFKYYNADFDQTIKAKNLIKFTVLPMVIPSYLSCALTCIDSMFPSDDNIRKAIGIQSPILKFYNSMITKVNPFDIIFDNLLRGQQYKLRCIIESIEGEIAQRTSANFIMDTYTQDDGTVVDIKTIPQEKSTCIQYRFDFEPSQNLKLAMVNACQNLFMQNGNWIDNGCIICADPNISIVPSGFSLPKSIACSEMNTKLNFNNIYGIPNQKLRYLRLNDSEESEQQEDENVFNHKERPKFLVKQRADIRNLQNDTIINSTANQNSEQLSYQFSICPIPFQICPSNLQENKKYEDYLQKLNSTLVSPDNLKQLLNNTDTSIKGKISTIVVKDEIKPNLSNLTFEFTYKNISGLVKWKAKYSRPLYCYWKITDISRNLEVTTITQCTDLSYCGNFKVFTEESIGSTNINYVQPLNANYEYWLFLVCYNYAPYPTLPSDVLPIRFYIEEAEQEDSDYYKDIINSNFSTFIRLQPLNLLFFFLIIFTGL